MVNKDGIFLRKNYGLVCTQTLHPFNLISKERDAVPSSCRQNAGGKMTIVWVCSILTISAASFSAGTMPAFFIRAQPTMIQILDVRNKTLIHYPLESKLVFWGTAKRIQTELFVQNCTELLSETWPLLDYSWCFSIT